MEYIFLGTSSFTSSHSTGNFGVPVAQPRPNTRTDRHEHGHGSIIDEEDCLLRNASLPPENFRRRSPGEVQVVFNDYVVREGISIKSSRGAIDDSDESTEDDSLTLEEREERRALKRYKTLQKKNWTKARARESYGAQVYQRNEYDTYEVIPLQYLYNDTEMEYIRFPPEIEKPSGLRIMWVYIYSYYGGHYCSR